MKRFLFVLGLLLTSVVGYSQNTTLVFDFERSTFDQDPELPAQEYFTITGGVAPATQLVELTIGPESSRNNKVLYQNSWVRSFSGTANQFVIPVNYRLASHEAYDISIKYFRTANKQEAKALQNSLREAISGYLQLNIEQRGDEVKLNQSPDDIAHDLDLLVTQSLAYYTNRGTGGFKKFSDLPRQHIRNLRGSQAQKANAVSQTTNVLMAELSSFLNSDLLIQSDQRMLDNYQTERISRPLTVHGGYGVAFFNNSVNNLETSGAAMAGLSFPFSRQRYNSAFLANSAIIVGLYVSNLEDDSGTDLEGPLFNIPMYAGLGYKALQLVRINAGAVVLEDDAGDKGVYVRPFVGLSIDLDIWAKISR
jgi:hypothetical protein